MSKVGSGESKNTLYCSFCGKSQHEVRKLIAGPTVFICDECFELCMIYHPGGSRNYGRTKTGAYMCEQESLAAGFRAPKATRRAAM